MRNYTFQATLNGMNIGDGYGSGDSPVEAFESGIEQGTVGLQGLCNPQEFFDVVATSETGWVYHFETARSY